MSSERRRRRFWYVIGAALITTGALLGMTVSVIVVARQAGKAPTDDHASVTAKPRRSMSTPVDQKRSTPTPQKGAISVVPRAASG